MRKKPPIRHEIKPRYHPSGRPMHNDRERGHSMWRVPPDEALTPRLRPGREQQNAIGFTARLTAPDDDE